jgi:hypothetical protein
MGMKTLWMLAIYVMLGIGPVPLARTQEQPAARPDLSGVWTARRLPQ